MRSICLYVCVLLLAYVHNTYARSPLFQPYGSTGPFIKVSTNEIVDYNEPVIVAWGGVYDPHESDILYVKLAPQGMNSPLPNTNDVKPLGYYPVTWIKGWEKGSGIVSVPVYQSREYGFYFEYFTNKTGKLEYVMGSTGVFPSREDYTHHFRIALTHVNSEMRITYTTTDESSEHTLQVSTTPFTEILQNANFYATCEASDAYCIKTVTPKDTQWGLDGMLKTDTQLQYVVRELPTVFESTYTIDDMVSAPGNNPKYWVSPGKFRTVVLTQLQPNTKYYYRVLDAQKRVISKQHSFISNPDHTDSADVFVFGDLGVVASYYMETIMQNAALETVHNIKTILQQREQQGTSRASLILHLGDISYARGYAPIWDLYQHAMEPLTSQLPYMVSMGNHEYGYKDAPFRPDWADYDINESGGEAGIPLARIYQMPNDYTPYPYLQTADTRTSKALSKENLRNVAYSFEYGPVHFTIFSAEHDFLPGSEQYKFIEADLQAVNRTKTPWVIVGSHRPMYCTATGCSLYKNQYDKMDTQLRTRVEVLLKKYAVDMYICGHLHLYERTCAIYDYKCADSDTTGQATVHVTTGAAGHSYQRLWAPNNAKITRDGSVYHKTRLNSEFAHTQPDWAIFRTMNFGFSHFNANHTHLHFKYYGNKSLQVHDEFVLSK